MKKELLKQMLIMAGLSFKSVGAKELLLIIDYSTTLRPVSHTGSGRYSRIRDVSTNVIEVLNKLKIDYYTGNDAPRGGKTGFFIKLLNF